MKKAVKAEIVDRYSKKSTGSGVARGVVGNAIAGPAGMVAGAALAKNKQMVTFLVTYDDGSTQEVEAKKGSVTYRTYEPLLENNIKARENREKQLEKTYGKKNLAKMRTIAGILAVVAVFIVILCIICAKK